MVESSERPVLVVEDDPKVRALLAETLKGDGYAVEAFESALGLFPEMKRLRPCAVVLDLGLPYRSGLRLLTELKDDPTTAAVPVIIVSGQPLRPSSQPRCGGAGRSRMVTRVPAPGALSTARPPPWASTRLLAMASPSPAPPCPGVRDGSAR